MKFGLFLQPYPRFGDIHGVIKTAQLADDLGFDTVGFGEQVVWPTSHLGTVSPTIFESTVLMTALALATKRIVIYPTILVLPYHHPVRLAKAIATLDHLCNGRLMLGIGVGWLEQVFPVMGVSFKERGAMSDEYILAMKELWTSERPQFSGRYVSFKDLVFEPRPLQKPHPPLIIGGYVRRALVRAAEFGDGAHPGSRPWEQLKEDLAYLRGLLKQKGRTMDRFPLCCEINYGATPPEIAAIRRKRGLHEFPPLSHDPDKALEQIAAYAELGFTHLVVRFPENTMPELHRAMERFSREIMELAKNNPEAMPPLKLQAKAGKEEGRGQIH